MRNLLRALVRADGSGLFAKTMSAGFWAMAMRVVLRLAMIVRTIILARLLAPDDFGLMAIATLLIVLLEALTQSGYEAALVQHDDDIAPYLNTAWTLQVIRGLTMAGVLVVTAPWVAQFFNAPEATVIIRVLAIAIVIKGFANIAVVSFIKELRFDKLFVLMVGSRGTDIVVSIVAAVVLRNVWALVLGMMAGAVANLVGSYLIDSYRPRIHWVWGQVRFLFAFGKWILASNALNFFSGNLDDILVGRILGVQYLGWYRMAYNFSQAVATELSHVTGQVAFPTYSKLQTAADRLRIAYMGTLHFVAFLGFPIAFGTIVVADDLTYGILGSRWAPIIVPMQILAIAGLTRGISSTAHPLFTSQGRPDLPPRFSLTNVVIMAALLYPAIDNFELNGAAGVVVFAQAVTGVSALALALSMVRAKKHDVIQAFWFPALNTAIMMAVVLTLQAVFFPEPSAVSFLVLVGAGVLVYVVAVILSTRVFGYAAPTDLLSRIRRAAT